MSALASAALARFDHHVGKLLDAWRAAYEVHDGEGLQVLGDAAGSGGGLGVHLVVQGQNLRDQTSDTSQGAVFCEERAQSCGVPPPPVVPGPPPPPIWAQLSKCHLLLPLLLLTKKKKGHATNLQLKSCFIAPLF